MGRGCAGALRLHYTELRVEIDIFERARARFLSSLSLSLSLSLSVCDDVGTGKFGYRLSIATLHTPAATASGWSSGNVIRAENSGFKNTHAYVCVGLAGCGESFLYTSRVRPVVQWFFFMN